MQLIFKILTQSEWQLLSDRGRFDGAPVDLADGFIHFSTAEQVAETARKHFSHQADLMLVAVDPQQLGDTLKYEVSRGGALFPHYYGTLVSAQIVWAKALPLRADGVHEFKGLIA